MDTTSKQHYAFWQAPVAAFYNKSFYLDVATNWKGYGILYMFLMCLIAMIIGAVPFARELVRIYNDQDLKNFLGQVPTVNLNQGQVSIDKPCPYQIKDLKAGTVIAEFRTDKGGDPKLSPNGTNPPIIVTKDLLYMANPGNAEDAKQFRFADWGDTKLTFNGSDILNIWQSILIWFPLSAFVICIPLVLIGHVFQMLVYGGIESLICANSNSPLPFDACMRLAAMAMTPVLSLQILFALVFTVIPVSTFGMITLPPMVLPTPIFILDALAIPIALVYLFVAAKAVKQPAAPAA